MLCKNYEINQNNTWSISISNCLIKVQLLVTTKSCHKTSLVEMGATFGFELVAEILTEVWPDIISQRESPAHFGMPSQPATPTSSSQLHSCGPQPHRHRTGSLWLTLSASDLFHPVKAAAFCLQCWALFLLPCYLVFSSLLPYGLLWSRDSQFRHICHCVLVLCKVTDYISCLLLYGVMLPETELYLS